MTLQVKLIALLLSLLVSFSSGFGIRSYIAKKQNLEKENIVLSQALLVSSEYEKKILVRDKQTRDLQLKLSAIDKELTRARTSALAENTRLRVSLDVAKRMRLKGSSCPSGSTGDQTSSNASVDNGSQVELSDQTRLAVFDLRESIISDEAALKGCQAYVKGLGLYP